MSVSVLSACGPTTKHAASPKSDVGPTAVRSNPTFITPARWFASVTSPDATSHGTNRSGSRLVIVKGLRMEEAPDGSLARAAEFLPSMDPIVSLELPDRFGGGYLYYASSEDTAFWRSSTWTGKLKSLAEVPLETNTVVAGLDRLYLTEEHAGEVLAIDPDSGQLLDLGPLPPAPAYGSMAFLDAWFGAVEVPYLGVMATFDAGDSWHPVRLPGLRGVERVAHQLVLRGAAQDLALEPSGRLHPLASDPVSTHRPNDENGLLLSRNPAAAQADPRDRPPRPRLTDALRKATLHGWPDTSSTAVLAEGGALARIRLSDGKLLDYAARMFGREGGACHALALENGFGFVCSEPDSATTVYRFVAPLGVERLFGFPEPRQIMSSGNGSLVIRGACTANRAQRGGAASAPSYCVWGPETGLREIPVHGDPRAVRAVALRNGSAALITPPRAERPGELALIGQDGSASLRQLRLAPGADKSTGALLGSGFWLDGATETAQGELAVWVASSTRFAGIRVGLDGRVSVGPVQEGVDQTLFSGLLALGIDDTGTARESVDGGLGWKGLELPATDIFPEPNERKGGAEAGCSRVGCAFGAWLRVGWLAPAHGRSGLDVAEVPKMVTVVPPAGGRWRFECAFTGKQSVPRATSKRPATNEDEDDNGPAESWLPLYGSAPRAPGPNSTGLSYKVTDRNAELHAYVWGPRGAPWEQGGRWQLVVSPTAAVSSPAWSTSISRSPWNDMASAAETFGRSPSGNATTWSIELEPSGEAGILRSSSPSGVTLYLFERGRSIVPLVDAPAQVSRLLGLAKVGDHWYFAVKGGSLDFRVYQLRGNRAELLAEYGEVSRRLEPRLVRDDRARALGIWAKNTKMRGAATTWYVYPLEARTGRVSDPLVLTPQMLGAPPRPCGPNSEGWILDGDPPVQPLVQLVGAPEDTDNPRGVTARLLAGAQGLCIAALSARIDGDKAAFGARTAPHGPNPTRPSTVLALQSTEATGRRRELRCIQ